MKRRFLVALAVVLLFSLVVGCAKGAQAPQAGQEKQPQAPAAAEKVIKIGASVPLTGSLSKEGKLFEQGYRLWEDYINKKGGIKVGNTSYKVQLILYDDKSDAQTAGKLTEKLITEDKVDFLLSPYSSGLVHATSSIAEKYQVVNIAPIANAESLYKRGYKWLFGILPRAANNVSTLILMAHDYKFDVKTVAIVTPDDMFPLATAEGVKQKAEELGMKVVAFIKYPKDSTDLSAIVSQLKGLNADAIIDTAFYEGAVLLTRQLKEQRVTPKMLGFQDAPGMPDFVKSLGKDAEGIFGTAWWTPNTGWKDSVFGSSQDFARLFKEKYGVEQISYHPAGAAAGAEVLQLAIEKAGSLDKEKVREALLTMDVETFFMPVKFGSTDGLEQINVAGRSIPLQIQNGKPVVVYPERFKQADPIFPLKPWDQR